MDDGSGRLAELDRRHVWHPFTPMARWRAEPPLIIEAAEGFELIDADGRRYLDGVSSLWCNLHGHRVPAIDEAIRRQLDKVAHSTLLGLASPPSIELAARLAALAPGGLEKVFYSDAGATAVEVACKMAVGYWNHAGRPRKNRFLAFRGAYHGDTTGSMSIGYCPTFHAPFRSMLFPVSFAPVPDPCRPPAQLDGVGPDGGWPSQDAELNRQLCRACLDALARLLAREAETTAAIVIEPLVQGAAGMICQPPGFLRGVADLARRHDVLLIADEVATGFARTGRMFACEHEDVAPDIMCVAKGLSGGYLPLAATMATERIEAAFDGSTLFHGHTFTGNALACAASLASLDLLESGRILEHVAGSEQVMARKLEALAECDHVLDVRRRGVMAGVELCRDRRTGRRLDPQLRTGAAVCAAMRQRGLILRPLGDVVVLMPAPAMPHDLLERMLDIVVESIAAWPMPD